MPDTAYRSHLAVTLGPGFRWTAILSLPVINDKVPLSSAVRGQHQLSCRQIADLCQKLSLAPFLLETRAPFESKAL